jgi:hypothetical protein
MANGGGRSSSRNRSPGYYRSGRDEGYSGRPRRDEVEPRRRDSGRERERERERERDEGYGQREREKERDVDRKRYEEGVSGLGRLVVCGRDVIDNGAYSGDSDHC